MKSIKSKIKSWWTKRPMTYSLTHGSSTFSNKLTKFGSKDFLMHLILDLSSGTNPFILKNLSQKFLILKNLKKKNLKLVVV